ncbi:MAG: hypothetical protein PHX14_13275 [Syntrophomonadaceae bacterium]|nr:hypothetical protein [Syntrophomonadaceae bacterium]
MKSKVIIIDTSIMCCWLNVCGKETCGPDHDQWDKARVMEYINNETDKEATLVLPFPVIIETGNHIAQAADRRYECAVEFVEVINKAVDEDSPWAAFSRQKSLWDNKKLKELVEVWPEFVKQQKGKNLSMGDLMIKSVADFYSATGSEVVILTGDQGLIIHQNVDIKGTNVPRRRK